ncbi:hypothetical protein MMC17_003007 [Xylographa soralifera]|nr:hypothetical protein [Xylographa soralifera]
MSGIAFSNPARHPTRVVTKNNNLIRLCELHFEGIETTPRNSWMRRRLTKWWSTYPTGNEQSAYDRGLLQSAGYPPRAEVPDYLIALYPGLIPDPGASNQDRSNIAMVAHSEMPNLKSETAASMQTLDALIATIKAAPEVKPEPISDDEGIRYTRSSELGSIVRDEQYVSHKKTARLPRERAAGHDEVPLPEMGSIGRGGQYNPRETAAGYDRFRPPEMKRHGREEYHSSERRTAEFNEPRRPQGERSAYNDPYRPIHGTSGYPLRGTNSAHDAFAEALPEHSRGRSFARGQHAENHLEHRHNNGVAHHDERTEASSDRSEFVELQNANRILTQVAARLATARPDLSALVSAASIQIVPVIQSLSSTASVDESSYRMDKEDRSLERGSGFKRTREDWGHESNPSNKKASFRRPDRR